MSKTANYEQEAIAAGFKTSDGINGYVAGRCGETLLEYPEHLTGKRLFVWIDGQRAGEAAKEVFDRQKRVIVLWTDKDGELQTASLKGWSVKPGQYMSRLQRNGVAGEVEFSYYDGRELKRTRRCAI